MVPDESTQRDAPAVDADTQDSGEKDKDGKGSANTQAARIVTPRKPTEQTSDGAASD